MNWIDRRCGLSRRGEVGKLPEREFRDRRFGESPPCSEGGSAVVDVAITFELEEEVSYLADWIMHDSQLDCPVASQTTVRLIDIKQLNYHGAL